MYKVICERLRAIRGEYVEISRLADEKKQALIKNDYKRINAINEEEREHVARVAHLEKERMEASSAIAAKLHVDPETLTVSETARHADTETARLMLNEALSLVETLREIKEKNEFNRQLIEMNLSYTSFMLETFTKIEAPGSVYGETGTEEEYTSNRLNIFDSQI